MYLGCEITDRPPAASPSGLTVPLSSTGIMAPQPSRGRLRRRSVGDFASKVHQGLNGLADEDTGLTSVGEPVAAGIRAGSRRTAELDGGDPRVGLGDRP